MAPTAADISIARHVSTLGKDGTTVLPVLKRFQCCTRGRRIYVDSDNETPSILSYGSTISSDL